MSDCDPFLVSSLSTSLQSSHTVSLFTLLGWLLDLPMIEAAQYLLFVLALQNSLSVATMSPCLVQRIFTILHIFAVEVGLLPLCR